MKNNLIIIMLLMSSGLYSQPIPRQSIEDSVIGWMKVYNFKGVKAGMKVDDKAYSANQISNCDSFLNWIQASYVPKGASGMMLKKMLISQH